jgi:putative ATP-dependent endonuclease of OLD family
MHLLTALTFTAILKINTDGWKLDEVSSMIVKSVHVQNFRSIRDETLLCEPLTVLVGPNGAGKSSFLHALEAFYDVSARYTGEDFYAGDTSQPISITVTFTDLIEKEKVGN